MSQELKYASIDTMSKEDIKALFEIMCEKIFKKKPNDVKKEVLNIKGGPKEIDKYEVTAHDLINIVVAYDLKFEFKINWLEGEAPENQEIKVEKPVVTETANALAEQKNDIKNEDLQNTAESSQNIQNENPNKEITGDLKNVPNPNFLPD